jgi:hypothetical protein
MFHNTSQGSDTEPRKGHRAMKYGIGLLAATLGLTALLLAGCGDEPKLDAATDTSQQIKQTNSPGAAPAPAPK